MAEGDEYYYPLSFKDVKDPMFFLATLGRMPYTHINYSERLEYVEKAGFDRDFLEQLDDNEIKVKAELLNYVDGKDLESQEKFSNALNRMSVDKIAHVLNTLNEQQKKKRGIEDVIEIMDLLSKNVEDENAYLKMSNLRNILDE